MNIIKVIKEIYPEIESGFSYWETKYDGSPLENPIDGLVWENKEYAKPTWGQIETKLRLVQLQEAKEAKKLEAEQFKKDQFGLLLQVRSNPDYYLKPSPKENIFLASSDMAESATKLWRALDSGGNRLFNIDEDGNKLSPLFLELTKSELSNVSSHYEERKTAAYHQFDLKAFHIDEILTTIEEVESFDVTKPFVIEEV
jgi:hypothetical protein